MGDNLMPWHLNYMDNIDYDRVDLVKEGANSKAHIKIIKQRGGITMDLDKILAALQPEHRSVIEKALKDKEDMATAEADKAKKAEEDAAAAKDEVEKLKSQAPLPTGQSEDEIVKSIKDPAVRALMESQIAKTKVAEEQVRKAREAALEGEAIAKAKEVPGIGAEEATLATVYKKLKAVDEQLCTDVFGIFKAASNLVTEGSGAFTETGSVARTTGVAKSSDAIWAEIESIGKTIKGDNKAMTLTSAVTKALEQNPQLYAQYVAAQEAGL